MKRLVPWWGVVGLCAILLAAGLLFRIWDDVAAPLAEAGPPLIGLVTAWYLATLILRGTRWRAILHPVAQPTLLQTCSALAMGGLASMVGPVQVGTAVRGIYLSKWGLTPTAPALVTAAGDRLFDVLLWLLVLPLVFWLHPEILGTLIEETTALDLASSTPLLILLVLGLATGCVLGWKYARRRWGAVALDLRRLLDAESFFRALPPSVGMLAVDLIVLVWAARILDVEMGSNSSPLWAVIAASRGVSILGRLVPGGIFGLSLQQGFFFAALVALGASVRAAGLYVIALHASLILATVGAGMLVGIRMVGTDPPDRVES